MSCAIIIGATGQDGTYLTRLLQEKGYRTLGIGRHNLISNYPPWLNTTEVDISNFLSISEIIKRTQPDEIYHLAAVH